MIFKPALILLAAACLNPVVASAATPDEAKSIVVQHCVKCHATPGYNPGGGPPSVEAPTFQELADKPEVYTRERLRSFLRTPHWPMTRLILSDSDIDKLLAYLTSLRTER